MNAAEEADGRPVVLLKTCMCNQVLERKVIIANANPTDETCIENRNGLVNLVGCKYAINAIQI